MTPSGHRRANIGVVLFAAGVAAVAADTSEPVQGFTIGFIGPYTSWRHPVAVGAVAFDLDLRKNFEPALRERFGPPIIEIPNMHPMLKNVSVQMGTTHGNSEVGLKTVIDWFQGTGGSEKVVGIVGPVFSSIAMPIASTSAVFKVPQVAYGASSGELSDKTRFPFFSRVAAPNTLQAKAWWLWKAYFQVPSLVVFYSLESLGIGFYEAIRALASEAEELDKLLPVAVENQDVGEEESIDYMRAAARQVRATGSRFVLVVSTIRPQMLYALEQEDILYDGAYQYLSVSPTLSQSGITPSKGFPLGYQVVSSLAVGPLYNSWLDYWTSLTPEDLYSEDAQQRYNHGAMKMPFSGDSGLAVTASTFTLDFFNTGLWILPARSFDGGYSVVHAINNLLNKNVPPEEIGGQMLLDELRGLEFNGVTSVVSFDANGDLQVDFGLQVATTNSIDLEMVGVINPGKGTVQLHRPEGVMWGGGVWNVTRADHLLSCYPGDQWNDQLGRCAPCPNGFFSQGGELPQCKACPVGTTSSDDATECLDCSRGWFNALPGDSCSRCAPGEFSAEPGASACASCDVGTFTDQLGSSGCRRCGAGHSSQERFTTMVSLMVAGNTEYNYVFGATSETFCVCDRGTRNDTSGECIPCTEGLACPGKGNVFIEEGYYASTDLSVFRCHGDTDRCPGGKPGESCAEGRTALVCAECEDDKTPASGGKCEACGSSDQAPFAIAVLFVLGCLTAAYYAIDNHNRATQSHALLICTFALSQFVTTVQQIGVVGMLSFEWREPLKGFVETMSLLILNFNVLRLSCVGTVEPLTVYLMKVLAILVVLALVFIIHCIFVVTRHKGAFAKQTPVLISAIGTVFMVLYISVTSSVMEPWQCLSHPNDKWTVREYQSIICWETGEHATMLALGAIMFFLVPIGFIVCTCIIVREFPKRLRQADSRAVKAFSFLFFRFRPGCHQYVLVFVLRSFFVAVTLVIPDLLLQVMGLILILQVGLAVVLLWRPWRVAIANILEAIFACATMLLIALGAAYIPEEDTHDEGVAQVAVVCMLCTFALVPIVVSYGVWRRFFRIRKPFEYFLCHYKVGSGAWTRLLKFHLLDSGKVKTDVFVDSDNLDHLDHLFNYVGNDTGTLVVVGTQGIFQRPWCLGEMCTARLKSVKTVLLSTPSFQPPEESFVVELASKMTNLETLIESGMTIEMLQTTLQWIAAVPKIIVPPMVTVTIMDSVAGALVSKSTKAITTIDLVSSPKRTSHNDFNPESALICDHTDMEALATCSILRRMLTAHLADEVKSIPTVIEADGSCTGVAMALVICTNLAFTKIGFLKHLGQIGSTNAAFLPVIAQSGFQIPGKTFSEQLHDSLQGTGNEFLQATVVTTVSAMFKKIGATFEAGNASETVLQASAADIAKQIRAWFGTARTTTSSNDKNNRVSGSSRGQLAVRKVESSSTCISADEKQASMRQSVSHSATVSRGVVVAHSGTGRSAESDWNMDL